MISEVKQSVIDMLHELYPAAAVYDGNKPADFARGSFLVSIAETSYAKALGNRFNASIIFDIAYFPEDIAQGVNECYQISEEACRALSLLSTSRISKLTAKMEEDVLHIKFTVQYREVKDEAQTLMNHIGFNEGGN